MIEQKYLSKLKSINARLTKGRLKIIRLLSSCSAPLTAEFLVSKTKLNKTSVYRELDFLFSNNFIDTVYLADGVTRYEMSDRKHHHHLVCLKCKNIKDVFVEESFSNQQEQIQKISNFQVVKHNLEFFGYCGNCHQK